MSPRARRLCKWSNREVAGATVGAHLAEPGQPLCTAHAAQEERERPSAAQRGYGSSHAALRRAWAPRVRQGIVPCARCGEVIAASAPWALDHTPDRKGYLGPSHKTCNESAPKRRTA